MHVPQWLKPAFWGVVVGAVGIMILGFAWWGWVLGSTAEQMAKARAEEAVTTVLVPICVERFMGQADAAINDFSSALRVDPKLASALYGRGLARLKSGDKTGGAADISAARTIQAGIDDDFTRYGVRNSN